ncbi:hypothetical protein MFU01_18100 [Myxococcus fulvus]|uniref:Uncharacterized protein n=1 Tax=Myxococcus fulvus TaxID=33 RepID=A0A511SZM5_MYXFU|nr:hypothetical protein MFU01_18100 [Myxococcus fulvus]
MPHCAWGASPSSWQGSSFKVRAWEDEPPREQAASATSPRTQARRRMEQMWVWAPAKCVSL